MFHTFLIDENGQVVFVGNLLWNMETENLFKTTVEKHLYGADIGYNKWRIASKKWYMDME